jgi:hypothetical protein
LADGVDIKGDAFFDVPINGKGKSIVDAKDNPHPFEAEGEVRFVGSRIGGQLGFRGGRFRKANGSALNLERARVTGAFRWGDVSISGRIDLRDSYVGVLDDRQGAWPKEGLVVDGFVYGALAREAPRDWKQRRDWLRSQERYSSQPYRQLASIYRNEGNSRAARKILMEQFNAQLQRGSTLSWQERIWRWVLRATVGHGYEPWRAIGFALVIWAIGWAWVHAAADAGAMVPTKGLPVAEVTRAAVTPLPTDCKRRDYPCLVPALYSADLVFPIIKLDQRDNWRPNGALRYRLIVPILVAFGWTLTTLVVAGFTSIVRRE